MRSRQHTEKRWSYTGCKNLNNSDISFDMTPEFCMKKKMFCSGQEKIPLNLNKKRFYFYTFSKQFKKIVLSPVVLFKMSGFFLEFLV